jgi:hypothetical protein
MVFRRRRRGYRIPDVWLVGLGLAWLLWSTFQLIQTMAWKRAEGRITDVRVTEKKPFVKNNERSRRHVAYEYTVGDSTYVGDRIWRGLGDGGVPLPLLTQYKVDQQVRVYYDPDRPQEAVLSRRYSPAELLVLGTVGVLIVLKRRRQNQGTAESPRV